MSGTLHDGTARSSCCTSDILPGRTTARNATQRKAEQNKAPKTSRLIFKAQPQTPYEGNLPTRQRQPAFPKFRMRGHGRRRVRQGRTSVCLRACIRTSISVSRSPLKWEGRSHYWHQFANRYCSHQSRVMREGDRNQPRDICLSPTTSPLCIWLRMTCRFFFGLGLFPFYIGG